MDFQSRLVYLFLALPAFVAAFTIHEFAHILLINVAPIFRPVDNFATDMVLRVLGQDPARWI